METKEGVGKIKFLDKEYKLVKLDFYHLYNNKEYYIISSFKRKGKNQIVLDFLIYKKDGDFKDNIAHLNQKLKKNYYAIPTTRLKYNLFEVISSEITYKEFKKNNKENLFEETFLFLPFEGRWKVIKGLYYPDRKEFKEVVEEITKTILNNYKVIFYVPNNNKTPAFYEVKFEDKILRLFL